MMSRKNLLIALILGLGLTLLPEWALGLEFVTVTHAAGPWWYVVPRGDDPNACTSFGTTCAAINGVIGKASSGNTILVATRIYTGTDSKKVVSLSVSSTLSGGWNGTFATQSGIPTIDGEGPHQDITFEALDLATLTVNDTTPQPGQLITYTLNISGSSSLNSTNALISDTLPLGLTFAGPVELDPPQPAAIRATSALSLPTLVSNLSITAGQRLTVTFPVTVDTGLAHNAVLTNTATVTGTGVITLVSGQATITIDATQLIYLPIIFNSYSPPPVDGQWIGTTSRGFPMSFYVLSDGTLWGDIYLKSKGSVFPCSSTTLEFNVIGIWAIINNQLSYSNSTFSISGQFNSSTTASGTYSIDESALGCPPFLQSGTWTANGP